MAHQKLNITPGYTLKYDPGLIQDLKNIFRQAVGKENAVPRDRLVNMLARWKTGNGFERQVRAAILELRQNGWLICSTGGISGGYWLAANWEEVTEFITREYHSRAMSMLDTEKKMKQAAQEKWGPEQPRMF